MSQIVRIGKNDDHKILWVFTLLEAVSVAVEFLSPLMRNVCFLVCSKLKPGLAVPVEPRFLRHTALRPSTAALSNVPVANSDTTNPSPGEMSLPLLREVSE